MAEQLKHFFGERVVRAIAADITRVHRRFDTRGFVAAGLAGLERLSLTQRAAHLAACLRVHLPDDFEAAAGILVDSLGPELDASGSFGMEPFRYMPHGLYIARHGLDHFETSMRALHALTRRFTAEGPIRPFIERHPERAYRQLERWTGDPSVHVRRLVSEGTRPRLPWATRLREFQRDPAPVIALLERLKDDPERYVQRSVANNLNDIAKDHPDVVAEVCRRWSAGSASGGGLAPRGRSDGRRWVVKHALRTLVKRGDRAALAVVGADARPKVELRDVRVSPARPKVGGALAITFELVSRAARDQDLLVDYAVHFVKASGKATPKVFKLARLTLGPGQARALRARLSLAPMSTRRHYPGRHHVELIVNGVRQPLCDLDVER